MLAAANGPGVASFYGGHISSDFVWYSLVSAAVTGEKIVYSIGI